MQRLHISAVLTGCVGDGVQQRLLWRHELQAWPSTEHHGDIQRCMAPPVVLSVIPPVAQKDVVRASSVLAGVGLYMAGTDAAQDEAATAGSWSRSCVSR